MAPRLREVIASVPEVRGVMSHVGRPDDGTDVTSFFNLEFNVPLEPDGAVAEEAGHAPRPRALGRAITREEIQDELTEKFQDFPGGQLQLLAADPRQRRGGPLGRQGGQLGQALRHRPARRWRRPASGSSTSSRRSAGSRTSGSSTSSASPTWRSRSTADACARYGDQRRRRRGGRPGRHRRPGVLADGRGGEALRHRPPAARSTSATTPTVIGRIPVDTPGAGRQARRPDPPRRSSPRSTRTSRAPRTSTARTTAATSRSSSASAAATSPRPSPRPSGRSTTPRPGAKLPDGLPDRVVGRVRPDAGRPTPG